MTTIFNEGNLCWSETECKGQIGRVPEAERLQRLTLTIFLISCMTYVRDLHENQTLTSPFMAALRSITNINCESMFNKYSLLRQI